jgi:putative flippase GtrA
VIVPKIFALIPSRVHQFAQFVVIGTAGFFIDSGVLWMGINWVGLGFYRGRLVSFLSSATITWYLNRSFTYRDRVTTARSTDQWLRYLGFSVVGGLINYGVYCVFVGYSDFAAQHPTVAVAAGSIAGMLVNFSTYSLLVFRIAPGEARRS